MSIVEMKVPEIGESITEVTLSEWLVKEGEYVELDQPICEFESDKATLEFPAEAAGILMHVASEEDDLEIGALVAKIDTSQAKPADSTDTSTSSATPSDAEPVTAEVKVEPSPMAGHPSPAAAKMMREAGVNPEQVKGTGKGGRITKADAQSAVNNSAPKAPTDKSENSTETTAVSQALFSRNTRTKKMSRLRRTIATRLVSAKNNTAMLTTFNEADMSAIFKLRKTYQEKFVEKYGVKLGFMSIFCKACSQVLMEMPEVNAQLDGNNLLYHDYVDISIAISTPTGLVVPPVKNIESRSFAEIELAIKDLAGKARENKLTLDELRGGTFTITNGGVFGSMMSTPILNEPQSAILGMHNIVNRPVAVDGEVVIRPMMYLAMSYDHRVIDGSSSVTFLVKVKELLEDPVKLLMNI